MPKTKRKKQEKPNKYLAQGGFDVPFLIIVLILLTIGLVMLFSASYTYAYYNRGQSAFFL